MSTAPVQFGAVRAGEDAAFAGTVKAHSVKDYAFQVTAPIIVGARLSGLSSKGQLLLLDANRATMATFSSGRADDSFIYTFSPGTYYVRVAGLRGHKVKYHLDVTATALPTPPAPPGQTNQTNGNGSGNGSGNGGSVPASVEQVITGMNNSINKFVTDAATVELHAPTLLANYGMDKGLVQIGDDMKNGKPLQAFADLQSLGQVVFQEAEATIHYGLPLSDTILDYKGIQDDLVAMNTYKQQTYALIQAIAKQDGLPLTSYVQSVMGTPLFAPPAAAGNYQTVVGSPTVANMTSYSPTSLGAEYDYYLSNQTGLESEADYYYDNFDYSGYTTFKDN